MLNEIAFSAYDIKLLATAIRAVASKPAETSVVFSAAGGDLAIDVIPRRIGDPRIRILCAGETAPAPPIRVAANTLGFLTARDWNAVVDDGTIRFANGVSGCTVPWTTADADFAPPQIAGPRSRDLLAALTATLPSASVEATRYFLNGVHVAPAPNGEGLRVAATDGHRLVTAEVAGGEMPGGAGITIPKEAVAAALKMAQVLHRGASVRLVGAGRAYCLKIGSRAMVYFAPIDGAFPEYDRCIPRVADATSEVTFGTRDVDVVLRVMRPARRDTGVALALAWDDGATEIRCSMASDTGARQVTVLPLITPAKGAGCIGFQHRYVKSMRDALATDGAGQITMRTTDWNSPALLTGAPGVKGVLMPCRV